MYLHSILKYRGAENWTFNFLPEANNAFPLVHVTFLHRQDIASALLWKGISTLPAARIRFVSEPMLSDGWVATNPPGLNKQ